MRRVIDTKSSGLLLDVKPQATRFVDTKPVVGHFDNQRLDDIITNLYPGMSMGPGWYMYVTYPQYVVVSP
jgi:hypothetical protein